MNLDLRGPRVPFHVSMLLLTGMVWATESMELLLLSFISPSLRCVFHPLSSSALALLTFSVGLGMLLGNLLWGFISDHYGRRPSFISSSSVTALFGILSALAPTYAALLLCRFCVGVGVGGAIIAVTLLTETAPPKRRGEYAVLLAAFWGAGAVAEAALAYVVLPAYGWRWLVAATAVPVAAVAAVTVVVVPESVEWLRVNGRHDEADAVARRIAQSTVAPQGDKHDATACGRRRSESSDGDVAVVQWSSRRESVDRSDSRFKNSGSNTTTTTSSSTTTTSTTSGSISSLSKYQYHEGERGIHIHATEESALMQQCRDTGVGIGISIENDYATTAKSTSSQHGQSSVQHQHQQPFEKEDVRAMWRRGVRYISFVLCMLYFFNAVLYYGIVLIQPEMLSLSKASASDAYTGRQQVHPAKQCIPPPSFLSSALSPPGARPQQLERAFSHSSFYHYNNNNTSSSRNATYMASLSRMAVTAPIPVSSASLSVSAAAAAAPSSSVPPTATAMPAVCAQQLTRNDFASTLWSSFGELPVIFLSLYLVSILGRRPLIIYMLILLTFIFLSLQLCLSTVAQTFLFFAGRGLSTGAFQTVILLCAEIYPAALRSSAMGVASAASRVGLLITPFVAQVLTRLDVRFALSTYAACTGVCAVLAVTLPVETVGRNGFESIAQLVELVKRGDRTGHFKNDPNVPRVVRFFRLSARVDGVPTSTCRGSALP